jgi:hypothetical protein
MTVNVSPSAMETTLAGYSAAETGAEGSPQKMIYHKVRDSDK